MKALLVPMIVLAWSLLAMARNPYVVDPAIEVPVSKIQAQLGKIKIGMTRGEVEEILDPDWEVLSASGGAGRNLVYYHHHKFPGYGFHICYRFMTSALYSPTLEDPVLSVHGLYRFDRQPVK